MKDLRDKQQAAERTLSARGWRWADGYWQPPLKHPCAGAVRGRTVAAVVVIETDEPLLYPENIETETAAKRETVRDLIIDHAYRIAKVVAVMPEHTATLLLARHAHGSLGPRISRFFWPRYGGGE